MYTLAGEWGTGSHPLVLPSVDVSRQSTGLAETMRLKASKSVQVNGSAKRSKQPARIGKDNSSRNRDGRMLDVGQHGGQSKARVGDETRPTIPLKQKPLRRVGWVGKWQSRRTVVARGTALAHIAKQLLSLTSKGRDQPL